MKMSKKITIRPRYGEVDQMGYVYHANYIHYCHQARTELFRKLGICDRELEKNQIMLPVISFDLSYRKPAHYDEILTVKATLTEVPTVKSHFSFEIFNQNSELVCTANSTVAFVDSESRKPVRMPRIIARALKERITN